MIKQWSHVESIFTDCYEVIGCCDERLYILELMPHPAKRLDRVRFYKPILSSWRLGISLSNQILFPSLKICDLGVFASQRLSVITGFAVVQENTFACCYAANSDSFEFFNLHLSDMSVSRIQLECSDHFAQILKLRSYRRRHLAKTRLGWIIVYLAEHKVHVHRVDRQLTCVFSYNWTAYNAAVGFDYVLFHVPGIYPSGLNLIELFNGKMHSLTTKPSILRSDALARYPTKMWLEKATPGLSLECSGNKFYYDVSYVVPKEFSLPNWAYTVHVTRWRCYAMDIDLSQDTWTPRLLLYLSNDQLVHVVEVSTRERFIKVQLNRLLVYQDMFVLSEHICNNKTMTQRSSQVAVSVLAMVNDNTKVKTLKKLCAIALMKGSYRYGEVTKMFIRDLLTHVKLFN